MADPQSNHAAPVVRFNLLTFLAREWPYLLVLILALIGVANTNVARAQMTIYWIVIAPFIGAVCVFERWKETGSLEERKRLVVRQALHWIAVLVAMQLLFIGDVRQIMSADGSALSVMTILALGTFTAGVDTELWRMCLVGIVLAIGVPAIAWFEESALLLMMAVIVLAAVAMAFFWRQLRGSKQASAAGQPSPVSKPGAP